MGNATAFVFNMSQNEDSVPQESPYFWSSESALSLEEFVVKYKPSMVQNDGSKPWIWVRGSAPSKECSSTGKELAITEASELLAEVTEKVEKIKNDSSIPTRSNKKTGAKSKKELREQVQAEATEKLKEISIRHGFVGGKWLIFAPKDRVDQIWSKLATSLVSGPLASTAAYLTKVSTCPESEMPNYQHVMCLYMPDVYDKDAVTDVMRILLKNHGLNLSGVKSDLYTYIGIKSGHPSGIQSTVWKNTSLMKDSEMKELKDAFFSAPKPSSEKKVVRDKGEASTTAKERMKPKLKKKLVEDDPFASDDEDSSEPAKKPSKETKTGKASLKSTAAVKGARDDPFASDEDRADEHAREKEKRKGKSEATRTRAKMTKSESKRAQDSGEDDSEDNRPKKKKKVGGK